MSEDLYIECDPENGKLCDACNPPHGTWQRYQLGDGVTRENRNGRMELVSCDCQPCYTDHRKHERWKFFQQGKRNDDAECPPRAWEPPVLSTEWKRFAACKGHQDLFFPDRGQDYRAAKQLCVDCPVQRECMIWGAHYEDYGIWGGVGEKRRIRFRAKYGVKRVNLNEVFV